MDGAPRAVHVSRREFLVTAGLAAGSALLAPVAGASVLGQTWRAWKPRALRVGVVLPASRLDPSPAQRILAGMRLYADGEAPGSLDLLPVQGGTAPGATTAAVQELVRRRDAAAVVALINPRTAARLRPILDDSAAIVVAVEAGANPLEPAARHPRLVHLTAGYWQANWAMGTWAGGHLGGRAVVAASAYESGYDAFYAFGRAFEAAGGNVVETVVTHPPSGGRDVSGVIAAVRARRPDFVYAMYGGGDAVDFVRAYAASGLPRSVPLAGSGFLVDEGLLPRMGSAALGIRSCLSWAAGLERTAGGRFAAAFTRSAGQAADVYAALGHEAARWLHRAAATAAGAGAEALQAALTGTGSFAGPRGPLALSGVTGVVDAPLYLREVRQQAGRLANAVVAPLARTAAIDPQARAVREAPHSGWLDAYGSY